VRSRSRGLAVFAILYILTGFALIAGGLPYLSFGLLMASPPESILPFACFCLMGSTLVTVAIGIWKGFSWAWWCWLGLSAAGIAIAAIIHVMIALWFPIPATLVPVPLFLRFFVRVELAMAIAVLSASLVSIWYATRPHVKEWFGVA